MDPGSDVCGVAIRLPKNVVLQAVQIEELIFCLLAFITLIRTFVMFVINRPMLHRNLQILFANSLILCFLHAFFLLGIESIHQYRFHSFKICSDLIFDGFLCTAFRGPIYFAIVALACTHMAIAIERLIATYTCEKYENASMLLGICLMIGTWLVAIGCVVFFYVGEVMTDIRPYCIGTTATNRPKIAVVYYMLLVLEIVAIVIFGFLVHLNRNRRKQLLGQGLSRRFQLQENIATTCAMVPIACVQFFFFGCFFVVGSTFRVVFADADRELLTTLLEAVNILPIYDALMPLLLVFLNHKMKKYRTRQARILVQLKHNDQYFHFRNLTDQWNRVAI